MIGGNEIAAGGKPPAVFDRDRWVDWRERHDRPIYAATLWPNRSLDGRGRRSVLLFLGIGLSLPLATLVGTLAFWGMLPFLAGTLGLVWLGFRRNDRDGWLAEDVAVWPDEVRVERREPSGRCLRWTARPLSVRIRFHPEPVESYLTLKGPGREVELGRFLSPGERKALGAELETALGQAIRGRR